MQILSLRANVGQLSWAQMDANFTAIQGAITALGIINLGTTAIDTTRVAGPMALTGITSIDGNAATVTTNANLTGDITSIGNATTLASSTVMGKLLTGYNTGAATAIGATDSILVAFEKLQAQVTALTGAFIYKGPWNPSTNVPALASGAGVNGAVYICSTTGTTTLDGISTWNQGDKAIFNGSTWSKYDGISNETITLGSTVITLNGTATTLTGLASVTSTTFVGALTGNASTATSLVGGNNTTLLGAIPYQSNTNTTSLLSPNITTTKNFLTMTGSGANGAAPVWGVIASGDLSTALATPSAIGGTTPSTGQFTVLTHTQKANFAAYANTAALGDLWFNSTQLTFCASEGAAGNPVTVYKQSVLGIAKSTGAVTFAAATTYYPILTTTLLGTLTLPANFLVVGKTIELSINGVITIITTASTVTAQVQIGATNITFPVSASLGAGSYNFTLNVTAELTAAGYLQGMGTLTIAVQGGTVITSYGTINIPATTAIVTSGTNAIGCSFQTATLTNTSTVLANNAVLKIQG